MTLAGLSRNEENVPIASVNIGIIPIVQNSLPAPLQVRHGFSSLCNAFKSKDINYMVQGGKVSAPHSVFCFPSHVKEQIFKQESLPAGWKSFLII